MVYQPSDRVKPAAVMAFSITAGSAAAFLRDRGFEATVVEEIEPGLPIVFVVTDAMPGTVLNFRPHLTRMPRPD